jgi:predicted RNA binding protein YcfA (HicA-like mRNA interferase family)
MPERYSSEHIITVPLSHGFMETGHTGSHKKFRREDKVVIVPHPRKVIPVGTFGSILRQSGLKYLDFKKKH